MPPALKWRARLALAGAIAAAVGTAQARLIAMPPILSAVHVTKVFPAGRGAERVGVLQESDAALRPAARFTHAPDENRLVYLERNARRESAGLRSNRLAHLRLSERDHRP